MKKNDLLNMNISDFLKEMAEKGKIETKFVLDKATHTFEINELKKVSDVLSYEEYGKKLFITGGPRVNKYKIYTGRTKYGWKTHEFVKACFKIAGIKEEEFGTFLKKTNVKI
ncbi:TPA: hypothetical protein DCZ39_03405 [Patescibacteria group bacterium]|nr:hypothetical protein [Candidatus Gracilibacteria bacterium]